MVQTRLILNYRFYQLYQVYLLIIYSQLLNNHIADLHAIR